MPLNSLFSPTQRLVILLGGGGKTVRFRPQLAGLLLCESKGNSSSCLPKIGVSVALHSPDVPVYTFFPTARCYSVSRVAAINRGNVNPLSKKKRTDHLLGCDINQDEPAKKRRVWLLWHLEASTLSFPFPAPVVFLLFFSFLIYRPFQAGAPKNWIR